MAKGQHPDAIVISNDNEVDFVVAITRSHVGNFRLSPQGACSIKRRARSGQRRNALSRPAAGTFAIHQGGAASSDERA
ncbi:MAG: hypothetical protein WCO31_07840 [Actinomycetes bacterium]